MKIHLKYDAITQKAVVQHFLPLTCSSTIPLISHSFFYQYGEHIIYHQNQGTLTAKFVYYSGGPTEK
jgi:hypothetical protein